VLKLASGRLPQSLEWGEVLVSIQAAPVNAADLYTAKMGGTYGRYPPSAFILPFDSRRRAALHSAGYSEARQLASTQAVGPPARQARSHAITTPFDLSIIHRAAQRQRCRTLRDTTALASSLRCGCVAVRSDHCIALCCCAARWRLQWKRDVAPENSRQSANLQVGAGVKDFNEGQWVIPLKSHMGCWRSVAVWKAKDLLKVQSRRSCFVPGPTTCRCSHD